MLPNSPELPRLRCPTLLTTGRGTLSVLYHCWVSVSIVLDQKCDSVQSAPRHSQVIWNSIPLCVEVSVEGSQLCQVIWPFSVHPPSDFVEQIVEKLRQVHLQPHSHHNDGPLWWISTACRLRACLPGLHGFKGAVSGRFVWTSVAMERLSVAETLRRKDKRRRRGWTVVVGHEVRWV